VAVKFRISLQTPDEIRKRHKVAVEVRRRHPHEDEVLEWPEEWWREAGEALNIRFPDRYPFHE
jgi:hypothetical protein